VDEKYKHPIDEKKVKFKKNITAGSKKENIVWIIIITVVSFFSSIVLSIAATDVLKSATIFLAFLVVLFIIFISIIFDIIGTAVTAADETPFHAMASRKKYGAKQSIRMIRNADKVSNLCNDVIGDICGVISGSAGAFIIIRIMGSGEEFTLIGLIITGFIASFTVGGKSIGKIVAIRNSNFIVYRVSVIIQFITGKFFRRKRKIRK
jgi:CBS domain containing-hemolysin-like protein